MTATAIQKIKNEIKKELLEEFILPMLENSKDPEGEYCEDFVKAVLKAAGEKPAHKYNSKSFLKLVS